MPGRATRPHPDGGTPGGAVSLTAPLGTPVSDLQRVRQEAAARASRRSILVAAASTAVVFGGLTWLVTSSPGWPAFRRSFLSWTYAVESFPLVLEGLLLNLRVMLIAAVLIMVIATGLALARTTTTAVLFPIRVLATAYTDVFRGLPLLLVILVLGLGVPALELANAPTSVVFYGGAALVLTYSAYVAEVLRAGIESVHPTQRMAGRALGLSTAATMRFVVLPQAVRRVTPALLNDLVSLQKDSGLISVLGAVDAIKAAQIVTAKSFNFTPYLVAGLLFVALTIPMTRFTDWLAARTVRRQSLDGPA